MICPYCGEDNDKVIDSRASEGGLVIRRRRACLACERRYTTYERVERSARLVVVKKDGSRTPYDSQNVLRGIQAACGKRSIPEDVKITLAQAVEDELHREFDREVSSQEIGKRIALRLRDIDTVAYIRFVSEYLSFKSLDDFVEEITDIKSRVKDLPNQQPLFQHRSLE